MEAESVAEIRSAMGEPLGEVAVGQGGYVPAHMTGLATHENDPVASLAIRDENPLGADRPTPKRSP